MTVRKWNYALRVLIAVLLVAVVGFTLVACDENNSTPVSGVYYYDAEGAEYTVTLSNNYAFTLVVGDEIRSGEYFYDGENLDLVFGEDDQVSATLKDGVLRLTYNGSAMNFIERVNYTVSFETAGGSAVEAVSVLNGQTVAQPADPARENSLFLGWFADSAYTTPFAFDSQIITGNTTVYARWADKVAGQSEYTVNFDANYQGAPAIASQPTFGGKLYSLPQVERTGYTFAGWWASSLNDGAKLSYQCDADYVYSQNVTLYAMWVSATGVKQPVVHVSDSNISWESTATGAQYQVVVTGPAGFAGIETTVQTPNVSVDFANQPAGVYQVSVTATTSAGQSETTVRYFVNKGLAQPATVTVVEPSTLVFSEVANAEKYVVTVECGTEGHNHVVDLGKATTYSFANCDMPVGGIKFTVTASANGYAPSNTVYVYNRVLPAIESVAFDAASETLSWTQVEGATNYLVTVTQGQDVQTFSVGTTSFSLKTFAAGQVAVAVVPQTKGYNSPEAAIYTYTKTSVATPSNLQVNGNVLTWSEVEGATYEVKVGSQVYTAQTASFDFTAVAGLTAGTTYQVSVRAKASTTSVWSDAYSVKYKTLENVTYYANVASWDAVVGATEYQVRVNEGTEQTVVGANYANVTLTQPGNNVVEVRFNDGQTWSNWVATTVYAYTVEFDTRAGAPADSVYVAVGDKVELATSQRSGYKLSGWYNAPGGADSNAYQYKNGFVYDQTKDTVVYAGWRPMDVTVSYNFMNWAESENANIGTSTVTFSKDYTLKVPTNPNTAYEFAGWYADTGLTIKLTDEFGNSLTEWEFFQEERTVYACWLELLSFTQLNDGTYLVKKGKDIDKVKKVTIPAEFNGVAVTQVGGYAFKNAWSVEEINIPDTIKYVDLIGEAFKSCTNLKAINVYHVEGNNEIIYSSSNGVLMVYDKHETKKVELGFVPLTMQGSLEIPEGVEVLPEYIFSKSTIEEVTIPSTVTHIRDNAFFSCTNLKKITFAPTAEGTTAVDLVIGSKAFRGCKLLEELTLPARTISITAGENGKFDAFMGCSALENIYVEEGCAYYKNPTNKDGVLLDSDNRLVYVPAGKSGPYTIPVGVTVVGEEAFKGHKSITEVVIPAWVTTIEKGAFQDCDGLSKVTFAKDSFGAVTIGDYAFQDCSALTQVVYEEGSLVTTIGDYAFADCIRLATLEVATTVTSVGDYAFSGCIGAPTAVVAEGTANVAFGRGVYENCTLLQEIRLPARVTEFPEGVFEGCDNMRNVFVDKANAVLCDVDGVLFTKDKKEILFYSQARYGAYELPEAVEIIGANVFENNTKLTAITIGANVKEIGKAAFKGCTNLKTVTFVPGGTEDLVIGESAFESVPFVSSSSTVVTLPSRLKSIGNKAFQKSSIYYIVFNEGLESIGDYAFANSYIQAHDSKDKERIISFPSTLTSVGDYAFQKCKMYGVNVHGGVTLGDYAFSDCSSVKSAVLGEGITAIPAGLFNNLKSMEELTLPTTLTSVGAKAFYNCSYLRIALDLSNVTTIGDSAFYGCSGLTGVTLSNDIVEIGPSAFYNCSKVKTLTLPNGLKKIGSKAFYGWKGITTLSIPGTVEELGSFAFQSCTGLTSVDFQAGTADLTLGTYVVVKDVMGKPKSVSYEGGVFKGCTSLTTVDLPDRVTALGTESFSGCNKLQTINISENSKLSYIGDKAFYNCSKLTSIFIPSTVSNLPYLSGTANAAGIGTSAFYGCTLLATVTFEFDANATAETHPLTIGATAFQNCKALKTLELPNRLWYTYTKTGGKDLEGISTTAFKNCTALESVTIQDGAILKAVNNVIYTADLSELIFAAVQPTGELTIPRQTSYISANAFSGNTALTKVIFENGGLADLEIGKKAFYGCTNVTEATLPERTTEIGESAFERCTKLTYVYIPSTVTTIAAKAFNGCTAVETLEFGYNSDGKVSFTELTTTCLPLVAGATSFTIPEGVTTLSYFLPYNTTIETVVFADTVTTLKYNAMGNFAGLKNIELKSTNKTFKYEDDVLYTADGASLILHVATVEKATFTVPAGTERISDNAFANAQIGKIIVANTVQYIGNGAFNSDFITEVELLDGDIPLTLEGTFAGNWMLQSVNIPARTTAMYYTFQGSFVADVNFAANSNVEVMEGVYAEMEMLNKAFVPAKVRTFSDDFNRSPNLQAVEFEKGSVLEYYELRGEGFINRYYEGMEPMTIVNFPWDTVQNYGWMAFAYTTVTEARFAEGVTEIPDALFYMTPTLASVTLPSTLVSIGGAAFAGTAITELVLPDSLEEIRYADYYPGAFEGCALLEKVDFGRGLQRIGQFAFKDCVLLEEAILPATLNNAPTPSGAALDQALAIDDSAFEGCSSLHTVEFLPGGTGKVSIGINAFKGTTSLTAIQLPYTLADASNPFVSNDGAIQEGAFQGSGLYEISIEGTSKIGKLAFADCANLKKVTLGYGLITIGEQAFANCANLEYVSLPETLKSFDTNPFFGCDKLYMEVDENNTDFVTINGVLYDGTRTSILWVSKALQGEIIMPETVENVLEGAFRGLQGITEVKLSPRLSVIPESMFEGSSITKVTIPNTVVTISKYAFKDCTQLQTVVFEKGGTDVLIIEEGAFQGCTSLTEIEIPDRCRAEERQIDGIKTMFNAIGQYAFAGCTQLSKVTFEEHTADSAFVQEIVSGLIVKPLNIGAYAFQGCTSLASISFPDRLLDPASYNDIIAIGKYAFDGCTSLSSVSFWIDPATNEVGTYGGTYISLGRNTFTNTALTTLRLPKTAQFERDAGGYYSIKYFTDYGYTMAGPFVDEDVTVSYPA